MQYPVRSQMSEQQLVRTGALASIAAGAQHLEVGDPALTARLQLATSRTAAKGLSAPLRGNRHAEPEGPPRGADTSFRHRAATRDRHFRGRRRSKVPLASPAKPGDPEH